MGEIWVRQFSGGLDTRRMPETTAGGALMLARDGHINRGGEFEQRAAFVPVYTLPAGTKSLAADDNGIFVFGEGAAPVGIPVGVSYQRLQHPDSASIALARVQSFDLYSGRIYSIALFADGSTQHFYNGTHIADWIDGRARGAISITGGSSNPASKSTATFTITGGTLGTGNSLINITLDDGTLVLGTSVDHTGDNTLTATAVASAIAAAGAFDATASGATVTVSGLTDGPGLNGRTLTINVGGDFTVGSITAFAGGVDATVSALTSLTVDGVSIINSAVSWRDSNEQTASDVADAVNNTTSTPKYVAVAIGNKVAILADAPGTAANSKVIAYTFAFGLTVADDQLTLASGAAAATDNPTRPGTFARTVGSKVYAVAGPLLQFSGAGTATGWNVGTDTGAGFIDMSAQASGTERLKAVAEYNSLLAVFAERVTLIFFIDPDPSLNKKSQTLRNTGTVAPRSVVGFGDEDVFYLDRSGIRSLRARYASTAASTTDIGVPVDTLITAKLKGLSGADRDAVIGLIEPSDNRFWLVFKDEIYVFSYFAGSKVSSWSTYTPSYIDADGVKQTFTIDDACVFGGRVYVRSGDTVFVYGGMNGDTYDAIEPEIWLPYLDAEKPAVKKMFNGVDVACEGVWEVRIAMQPTDHDASDKVGTVSQTTFNAARIDGSGESTHFSLRLKGIGAGAKKVSSVLIHYTSDADED